jgi:hypothetical protein
MKYATLRIIAVTTETLGRMQQSCLIVLNRDNLN